MATQADEPCDLDPATNFTSMYLGAQYAKCKNCQAVRMHDGSFVCHHSTLGCTAYVHKTPVTPVTWKSKLDVHNFDFDLTPRGISPRCNECNVEFHMADSSWCPGKPVAAKSKYPTCRSCPAELCSLDATYDKALQGLCSTCQKNHKTRGPLYFEP